MGKIILCAWIIGTLLVPSIWLNAEAKKTETAKTTSLNNEGIYVQTVAPLSQAEAKKNEITIPASSEKGDVYVRAVAPLSQDEAETYSALSKESKELPNLKAGESGAGEKLLALVVLILIVALLASVTPKPKFDE